MSSTEPRVSIVVPTLNGGARLAEVLDAIARQRAPWPFETVAVDSGSRDGTVRLLEERADRVLEVPTEDFDHGLSRNQGIAAARGEWVVLLVQDAVPAGDGWLARLAAPLAEDRRLAATLARQRPRPDASRLTRWSLARWPPSQGRPWVAELESRDHFLALPPGERFRRCLFDNVCSCLRRSVWQAHPFRAATIAEDLAWAKEVLLAGHRLAFVPGAEVVHSHERSPLYELKRTYLVHRRLWELFEMRTIPSLPSLLRAWAVTVRDHLRCLRHGDGPPGGPGEAARALGLAFTWPLGQYLGGLAAVRGRGPERLPGV